MIQTLVSLKLIICMVDYPLVILKTCPAAQVQLVAHPIHFLQQCKWSSQDALTSGVPASPCNWRNKYPGDIYVSSALSLMFRGKKFISFSKWTNAKNAFRGGNSVLSLITVSTLLRKQHSGTYERWWKEEMRQEVITLTDRENEK